MPPRTNAFQRLITLLTAALASHARVTESAMLTDRVTGERREVDVLIAAQAATYQLSLGIEVVSWGRPADTPWIEKMRAKHDNLPIDKLILVSESSFSAPAKRKAEFYGIETLTIEEACEADWSLIAALEETGVFEVLTINFDVEAVCKLDTGALEQLPVPKTASFPTPTGPKTIDTWVRGILDLDEFRNVIWNNLNGSMSSDFWLQYTEPNGLWRFDSEGKAGQITELRIGLKVLNAASPVRFACGKFRSTPFVSGRSTDSSQPLQFVLVKQPDGTPSGYLIDPNGLRTLTSRSQHEQSASDSN